MSRTISLIVYPVSDVAASKAVYTELLGTEPYVDQPYYVGYRVGDQEIGLDPYGARKADGPIGYVTVEDINKSLQAMLDAGAIAHQDVTDVGGGKLTALVKDASGSTLGLVQA
jgi:predicted enzyme related to lactoylglutathione lyase